MAKSKAKVRLQNYIAQLELQLMSFFNSVLDFIHPDGIGYF